MKKKIVLFLLGYKGFITLKDIINNGNCGAIDSVIVGKDNNIENDYSIEIQELCAESKVIILTKHPRQEVSVSFWIAIGWRSILFPPKNTTLFVIHDSLLPKYRGFSPLVSQLINGENLIGATCIIAERKYDEGDIVFQEAIQVNYPIKIEAAIKLVAIVYSNICFKLIELIHSGVNIKVAQQNESKATYSLWRDEEDYFINWELEAKRIIRTIDSLGQPYKGARARLNNQTIIIHEAIELHDLKIENRKEGKIIKFEDMYPIVVCGIGLIKILKSTYLENGNSIFPLKKFRSRFS